MQWRRNRAPLTIMQLVSYRIKLWGSVNTGRTHKPSQLKYNCISINNIIQQGRADHSVLYKLGWKICHKKKLVILIMGFLLRQEPLYPDLSILSINSFTFIVKQVNHSESLLLPVSYWNLLLNYSYEWIQIHCMVLCYFKSYPLFSIFLVAQFQGSISVISLSLLSSNALFKHVTNIKEMFLLISDGISDCFFYFVSHFKQNTRFI